MVGNTAGLASLAALMLRSPDLTRADAITSRSTKRVETAAKREPRSGEARPRNLSWLHDRGPHVDGPGVNCGDAPRYLAYGLPRHAVLQAYRSLQLSQDVHRARLSRCLVTA